MQQKEAEIVSVFCGVNEKHLFAIICEMFSFFGVNFPMYCLKLFGVEKKYSP